MRNAVIAVLVMMPLMFGSIGSYLAINDKKCDRFALFVIISFFSLVTLAIAERTLFK